MTFITTASHQESENNNSMREKVRVIEKSDIKSITQSKDNYPTPDDIYAEKANDLHKNHSAHLFRSTNSSIKFASLGQAIIQPCVILCPLSLALSVQLHHHFSSRNMINSLNSHVFCCSYSEVQCFE